MSERRRDSTCTDTYIDGFISLFAGFVKRQTVAQASACGSLFWHDHWRLH
jgi:hypothetical protein